MTHWVLIFWAATWYPQSAFSTSFAHSFQSRKACEQARDVLVKKDDVRVAICVEDGEAK